MKSDITDPIMFKQYLENKKTLADSTIYVYYKSLERFLSTDPDIDDLNAYNDFIVKYAKKKRCYHYYSVLKAYVDWKITDTVLKRRILDNIIKPKLEDPITDRKHLNDKELLQVINNIKEEKHKLIALLQMFTGARAGDILRMKRGSIVSEVDGELPVIKLNIIGKRRRLAPKQIYDKTMQELIMDYILNHFGFNDFYFIELSKQKTQQDDHALIRMNFLWYWNDLKQALASSNVDPKLFATHDFRRCFSRKIWNYYDKDISVLQKILDHRDPKTTMRYLRTSGLNTKDVYKKLQGF